MSRKKHTMPPDVEAPICPYCGNSSVLLADSSQIYHGRDFGPVYICMPCQAWVGCHVGTHKPLGRLANEELRRAKNRAHRAFDPLWKAKIRRDRCRKNVARQGAYKWLAEQMGITREDCHIGMFDVAQCDRVVEICAPYQAAAQR